MAHGREPNVCKKCGAPLRPDGGCIMGKLCDTVADANSRSLHSTRPKIVERLDAPAPLDAPLYERATNPGFPTVAFEDKTLPEPPESVDFCKGCGLHLDRLCTKCPICGSSHYPSAAFETAPAKPAPSSTREAYTAVKRGIGTPRAPQFDDAPVVTWVGPDGGSDEHADAEDKDRLPVPGIPDSKSPGSR